MTKIDLLPCPFCGGEAWAWNYAIEGSVTCGSCQAAITRQHMPERDTGYTEAIAAWNRRASTEAAHDQD